MGGRGADPGAARTVVAVVGIVVAAAAVLSPAAAGGLGKEGTCFFFLRPGRSDQRRLRSCAHALDPFSVLPLIPVHVLVVWFCSGGAGGDQGGAA